MCQKSFVPQKCLISHPDAKCTAILTLAVQFFFSKMPKKCSITMTILPISVCIYSLNNSVNRGISLCPINSRKCLLVNPQKSSFCEKMREFCHYPFSFTTLGIAKNSTIITKNHAFRFQKGYKKILFRKVSELLEGTCMAYFRGYSHIILYFLGQ